MYPTTVGHTKIKQQYNTHNNTFIPPSDGRVEGLTSRMVSFFPIKRGREVFHVGPFEFIPGLIAKVADKLTQHLGQEQVYPSSAIHIIVVVFSQVAIWSDVE